MNERILELMNEANKDTGFTFTMEQAKPVHELMEKFAVLIVRECIKISDETGTSSLISDRIAENFGLRSTPNRS